MMSVPVPVIVNGGPTTLVLHAATAVVSVHTQCDPVKTGTVAEPAVRGVAPTKAGFQIWPPAEVITCSGAYVSYSLRVAETLPISKTAAVAKVPMTKKTPSPFTSLPMILYVA